MWAFGKVLELDPDHRTAKDAYHKAEKERDSQASQAKVKQSEDLQKQELQVKQENDKRRAGDLLRPPTPCDLTTLPPHPPTQVMTPGRYPSSVWGVAGGRNGHRQRAGRGEKNKRDQKPAIGENPKRARPTTPCMACRTPPMIRMMAAVRVTPTARPLTGALLGAVVDMARPFLLT